MMLKTKFIKTLGIFIAATVLAGCSNTAGDKNNEEQVTETPGSESSGNIKIPEAGLVINIPEEYQEKGLAVTETSNDGDGNMLVGVAWYYKPVTDKLFAEIEKVSDEDFTEEMQQDYLNKMEIHSKYILDIVLVEEQKYKETKEITDQMDVIAGWDEAEELGVHNGYMYLAIMQENNTEGMDEKEEAQYKECLDYIDTIKESVEFTEIEGKKESGDKMPSFTAKDLEGNTVTDSIFKEKDLTVVNIWGTFCGPCIGEMPELAEWSKSMPSNVQLIGLVCDIEGENDQEHKDKAAEIMEKAGADFTNIIPGSEFAGLLGGVTGVPTTIFVDKEGNITGKPVVGANVAAYKKFVEDYISGK